MSCEIPHLTWGFWYVLKAAINVLICTATLAATGLDKTHPKNKKSVLMRKTQKSFSNLYCTLQNMGNDKR